MLTIMLNLIVIQLILVFITDISGFIEDGIEPLLGRIFKTKHFRLKPKPFKCSMCQTTWIGLLYLLIKGCFTIPMIGYVLLLAFLTPIAYNLLLMVKEALTRITNII